MAHSRVFQFEKIKKSEFDDNDIVVMLSVNSGNQEIDPFGCQRNLIFNCYLALIIYLGDIYGIS